MYQARTLPPSYIPRAWFLELGSLLTYLRLALKFAVLTPWPLKGWCNEPEPLHPDPTIIWRCAFATGSRQGIQQMLNVVAMADNRKGN